MQQTASRFPFESIIFAIGSFFLLQTTAQARTVDPLLNVLISQLKHPRLETRIDAIEGIGKFGKAGKIALDALLKNLQEKNQLAPKAVIQTFARIGAPALPFLLHYSTDLREKLAIQSIRELGKLKATQEKVLRALLHITRHNPSAARRQAAAEALHNISPAAYKRYIQVQFKSQDRKQRFYAMLSLYQMTKKVNVTLDLLSKLLHDKNPVPASRALERLGTLGPRAAPAIPKLLLALKTASPFVKGEIIETLGQIGKPAKNVVPLLLQFLNNRQKGGSKLNAKAAEALSRIAPNQKEVVAALFKASLIPNFTLRRAAVEALGYVQPPTIPVTQALIRALIDHNKDVKLAAAKALQNTPNTDALSFMVSILKTPKRPILNEYARAVAATGAKAIPHLRTALKKATPAHRKGIALAFSFLGPKAAPAIPTLILLLKDPQPEVFQAAQKTLRSIGEKAIPSLLTSLQSKELNFARRALETLLHFARLTPLAAEAIVRSLKHKDHLMRLYATQRLRKMGKKGALAATALLPLLQDPNVNVRREATRAFFHFGQKGAIALPQLLKGLNDKDHMVKVLSIAAIGSTGRGKSGYHTTLLEQLQHKDKTLRDAALAALGELGSTDPKVIQALFNAFLDPLPLLQQRAREAFFAIGPQTIPLLIPTLTHPNWKIRNSSALALGLFSKKADKAIPALLKRLKDKNEHVRQSTIKALLQIRFPDPS